MNKKETLSICIPTYNRATFLDALLKSLKPQYQAYEERLNICVSDNCSRDHTSQVISTWTHAGLKINYRRRNTTSGANVNIKEVVGMSSGSYVWCIGDDEILDVNCLSIVFSWIERGSDFILLNSRQYNNHAPSVLSASWFRKSSDKIFTKPNDVMNYVSAYPGFISAVIARSDILSDKLKSDNYVSCGWNHLYNFYAGIAVRNNCNGVLIGHCYLFACANNSGGYDWEAYFIEGLAKLFDDLGKEFVIYHEAKITAKEKVLFRYILRHLYGQRRKGTDLRPIANRIVACYGDCWLVYVARAIAKMPPALLNVTHRVYGRTV